jgi:hypothetical protein
MPIRGPNRTLFDRRQIRMEDYESMHEDPGPLPFLQEAHVRDLRAKHVRNRTNFQTRGQTA